MLDFDAGRFLFIETAYLIFNFEIYFEGLKYFIILFNERKIGLKIGLFRYVTLCRL